MGETHIDLYKLHEEVITPCCETSTAAPPSSSLRGVDSTTLEGPITITEHPPNGQPCEGLKSRKVLLPLAAFTMLFCGTLDMVILSWMNRHEYSPCDGCPKEHFEAQYLQLAINCIGQLVCLPIYWADLFIAKMRNRHKPFLNFDSTSESLQKEQAGPLLWLVPALCDFFGSLLLLYALRITEVDTAQVLRNFTVILCAFLSISFLKRDLKVYQWTGIAILTLGLVVTAYSSISASSLDVKRKWGGPLLVLVSSVVQVFLLVAEERILLNYQCAPFLGVGYIGSWQVAFTIVTVAIAHFSGAEDIGNNLYAMKSDAAIRWSIITFTAAMCVFTASGLAVTKMGAAMLTSIILNMRQVPIYIINLALGWGEFDLAAMFGLLLACIGFLMYNALLPTTWWPWLDAKFAHELRIRCRCADVDEDEYSWDSDYASSWAATTTTTTRFKPRRKRKRRRKIRTKIVNTFPSPRTEDRADLNRLDSGSTWICVRRSDEWVVDGEGKRVQ